MKLAKLASQRLCFGYEGDNVTYLFPRLQSARAGTELNYVGTRVALLASQL